MCFLFVFVFVSGKKFVQIYLHCVCISVFVRRPIIKRSGVFCLVIWGESSLFDLVICWLYLKRSSTIPFHNQDPKILQFGNASKDHGCYILNQNFSDPFVALSNDHDWQLCVVTGESSLSLSESFISSSIFIFFLVMMFKYSIPSTFHSRIKVDHGNDVKMTKYN